MWKSAASIVFLVDRNATLAPRFSTAMSSKLLCFLVFLTMLSLAHADGYTYCNEANCQGPDIRYCMPFEFPVTCCPYKFCRPTKTKDPRG